MAALMSAGVEMLFLPAAAFDGCKDLGEYWQTRRALTPMLVERATGPFMPDLCIARPRQAGLLHEHPAETQIDLPQHTAPPAASPDSDIDALLEESEQQAQWRLLQAQRCQDMTFETLPGDLQADARALAAELIAGGIDEIGPFWAHLEHYGRGLMAEDPTAAWYALETAIVALPDSSRLPICCNQLET
jgi:hypothetical protein